MFVVLFHASTYVIKIGEHSSITFKLEPWICMEILDFKPSNSSGMCKSLPLL